VEISLAKTLALLDEMNTIYRIMAVDDPILGYNNRVIGCKNSGRTP
jgi:hypothetical protein